MLWFDAEANFERFSKKENITYYLDLAKSTGFNSVVDVRPVQGDALFKSSCNPIDRSCRYTISKEIGIIFNFLLI